MIYSEIKDDIAQALSGHEGDEYAFRRVTEAIRLLNTKGVIDASTGELSVCVCGNFATLPREVDTVLGVQVDAQPSLMRNEWFMFHVNGAGDKGWTPFRMVDILGRNFCTFRDPDRAVLLAVRARNAADEGKKFRVYGLTAAGERIFATDATGKKTDGFFVPVKSGVAMSVNSAISPIAVIDHIWKEQTIDYVDLIAIDPTTNEAISTIGSYRPDETNPTYTRIRTPDAEVVRVKYRRRDFAIRSETDWINCDNSQAIILACRAVMARMEGKLRDAREYETEAARLINEDIRAARGGGIAPPQHVNADKPWTRKGLIY